MEVLLRLPDVLRKTGLRRSALYLMTRQGRFPRPVKLGERMSAWRESEVDGWIKSRIEAGRVAQEGGARS